MAKFADRLRSLRNDRGLSQQELAKQLGCVSKSSVNMYERGEREPDFEKLEAIADYFNVDMDYLLGKSDVPNRYRVLMDSMREEIISGRTKVKDDMFEVFGEEHSTTSLRLVGDKVALLYYRAMDNSWAAAMSQILTATESLDQETLDRIMLVVLAYIKADKPIKDIVDTALRPYFDKDILDWL